MGRPIKLPTVLAHRTCLSVLPMFGSGCLDLLIGAECPSQLGLLTRLAFWLFYMHNNKANCCFQ